MTSPHKIVKIYPSTRFAKSYRRLPARIQILAKKKDKLFRNDVFHLTLKTHKLSGKLKENWAYSIDRRHRVMFRFVNKDEVVYLDIGTHDVYQ